MINTNLFWWNKTITHYRRKVEDGDAVTYDRFVYNDCSFVSQSDKRTIGNDSKIIKVFIARVVGKVDVKNLDIIVLGEVDDEIDEYSPGYRSSDLLSKYPDSFIVNYVGFNDDVLVNTRIQGDGV